MEKFTTITGVAASLPIQNIDTDMIIPKQFLKTVKRTGLKEGLFYEMRYDSKGVRQEEFILHNAPFDKAKVLIANDNFGCGSSREHAPWALLDFGIKVIIAPSFADIFFNNCFKNSILPIVMSTKIVEEFMQLSKQEEEFFVDLKNQVIVASSKEYKFEIDALRKHNLLHGLDDIGLTLEKTSYINDFEKNDKQLRDWLY